MPTAANGSTADDGSTAVDDPAVRVVASWLAAPGRRDAVLEILRQLSAAALRERGCLRFEVLEEIERPGSFVLLERYADPAAHAEHLASAHFHELVLCRGVPLLAQRDVRLYRVPERREGNTP
jgi:quinol monooxygenase YgiN